MLEKVIPVELENLTILNKLSTLLSSAVSAALIPPDVHILVLPAVGVVSTEVFPVPPLATASVPLVIFAAEWLWEDAALPSSAVLMPPDVHILVLLAVGVVSTDVLPVPPLATASVPDVMLSAEWLWDSAALPSSADLIPPDVHIFVLSAVGVVSTEVFPVPPRATANVPDVMFAAEWLCEDAALPSRAVLIPPDVHIFVLFAVGVVSTAVFPVPPQETGKVPNAGEPLVVAYNAPVPVISATALVPAPFRIAPDVNVPLPVPPLATPRVPDVIADAA